MAKTTRKFFEDGGNFQNQSGEQGSMKKLLSSARKPLLQLLLVTAAVVPSMQAQAGFLDDIRAEAKAAVKSATTEIVKDGINQGKNIVTGEVRRQANEHNTKRQIDSQQRTALHAEQSGLDCARSFNQGTTDINGQLNNATAYGTNCDSTVDKYNKQQDKRFYGDLERRAVADEYQRRKYQQDLDAATARQEKQQWRGDCLQMIKDTGKQVCNPAVVGQMYQVPDMQVNVQKTKGPQRSSGSSERNTTISTGLPSTLR